MNCPNCHSPDHNRVVWGPRNVIAIVLDVVLHLILVVVLVIAGWGPEWRGVPLKRKCLKCGYKFLAQRPETPDFDECAQCGYNLKGNVSGRCSECGWRLPRRYRAYRRKADAGLRRLP